MTTNRLAFTRATKKQARLRMALDGPSGAGKTYTGLLSAFALAEATGARVAVIDTEHASASKYSDLFPPFDVLELDTFSPETYTEAIGLAAKAGYGVLLIDSLSHAWDGVGGALEMVDKASARSQGNSYTAWKDVTPVHRAMVEAILQSGCHIIVTMRSKMEYVLQEETNRQGKTIQVPRKVGMAPVQRQGMEYEFDIVADLDIDHRLMVSKSRCFAVADLVVTKPKGEWMTPVIAWLTSGEAVKADATQVEQAPAQAEPEKKAPPEEDRPMHWIDGEDSRKRFWAWAGGLGLSNAEVHAALGVESVKDFAGNKQAAVKAINAYIEARLTAEIANEAHIDSILDRGDV